jgi:hypothetical protein
MEHRELEKGREDVTDWMSTRLIRQRMTRPGYRLEPATWGTVLLWNMHNQPGCQARLDRDRLSYLVPDRYTGSLGAKPGWMEIACPSWYYTCTLGYEMVGFETVGTSQPGCQASLVRELESRTGSSMAPAPSGSGRIRNSLGPDWTMSGWIEKECLSQVPHGTKFIGIRMGLEQMAQD